MTCKVCKPFLNIIMSKRGRKRKDGTNQYEIECIMDHSFDNDTSVKYLVKYKTIKEPVWKSSEEFEENNKFVREYQLTILSKGPNERRAEILGFSKNSIFPDKVSYVVKFGNENVTLSDDEIIRFFPGLLNQYIIQNSQVLKK